MAGLSSSGRTGALELNVDTLPDAKDFTAYIPADELELRARGDPNLQVFVDSRGSGESFSGELRLLAGGEKREGRGLAAWCFPDNTHLSVTLRCNKGKDRQEFSQKSGWSFDSCTGNYLISAAKQARILGDAIFRGRYDQTGLIAIAASTGAGKSVAAKSLIHQILCKRKTERHRDHLVTFEDPIEQPMFAADCLQACNDLKIDYTPRQKPQGPSGLTLQLALQDALRQTPSVFYVGEVRTESDWKSVMDFAGSGHLIVTTTHASSIVEFFKKVCTAIGLSTPTPVERSALASKILGVVHLRPYAVPSRSEDLPLCPPQPKVAIPASLCRKQIALPALWRRTSNGVNNLIADGLASILPYAPAEAEESRFGALGRRWYVRKVCESADDFHDDIKSAATRDEDLRFLRDRVLDPLAIQLDLEEM